MYLIKLLIKIDFIKKFLGRFNSLLNQFDLDKSHFVGIYNNKKELIEDLSKKKYSQIIGNNDINENHVKKQIENNVNTGINFINDINDSWKENESFLCHVLTLFPLNTINVLDIGGGFKPSFFTLVSSLKQKKIKSHVVDFENIVKGANKIYNYADLKYSSSYPENTTFDVIYFGSSIQYFENLSDIYNKIKNYSAKLIVISYTSFAEDHETFTTGAYTSSHKFIVPFRVYNINLFIDFFSNNNFELIHKSLMDKSLNNRLDVLEIKSRIYNLVFEKKNID